MIAPLDIFAVNNGEATWLGCAESIAQAIDVIRKTGSGSYFVFSQKTGHKNFYEVNRDGIASQVGQANA